MQSNNTKRSKLNLLSNFAFYFLFIISSNFILAQRSGNILGIISDQASGDPLPGANVFLDGTSFGSATSIDGEYIIRQIPPGDYNMIVKYIGYKEKKIAISVKSGLSVEINVDLEYVAVESDEVLVSAQAVGQIEAINQQLSATTIKNVVSQDKIQDIPDANAAESVARLPGISIVRSGGEGQKVTIRGLSPKYNVMQVNGVRMQSTDRDDRSVDLNMIAPNVLTGIEVTKALTADMDADAVGGTVNLKIGKAQEGFHSNFAVQSGYGSLAETYGNYKLNGLVSDRFFDNKFGIQLSGFIDQVNRNSDVLSANWAINKNDEEDGLLISELASAIITDRVTDRKRMGAGLIFDYEFENGTLLFNNFISNLSEEQTVVENALYRDLTFSAFGSLNEVSNTVLNNALQGEFEFFNIDMDFSLSNSISNQYRPGDLRMNVGTMQGFAGLTVPVGFLPGESEPDEFLNTVSITDQLRATNFNTLKRDITESAQEAVLNFKIPYSFSNYLSGNLKFGGKYVHTNRKNDETQWFNTPDRVHVGELFVQLLEDSLWTDLGLAPEDRNLGIRAFLFENENYDIGDFLSGKEGINNFFFMPDIEKMKKFERLARANTVNDNGIIFPAYPIEEQPSRQYDYDYSKNSSALYAQTELNVGKYVTLYPGIRYESYNMDYTAYFTERFGPNTFDYSSTELDVDTINVIKDENLFPQMQMRIKPLDWLDIRIASTKSIIYPDYRAVSPYRYLNTFGTVPYLFIGNPFLKPAISQNFDIYVSAYDNYIGLLTAGFFYKEVDNLMVFTSFKTKDASLIHNMMTLTQTQVTEIETWVNIENTSFVRGFELDWQTHFWYLPSFLKGIVFNINYTHINSQTTYPFQTATRLKVPPFTTTFVDSSRSGRMPDQPNDILNATIGYDIADFSARLSFVYQDDIITSINRNWDELDSYTDAYFRWDFTALQKIPWVQGLQFYLNVNNITNEPDRRYISVLKKLNSVEYYGMTTDLGVRYEF